MANQYVNRGMLGDLFSPDSRDLLAEQQAQERSLQDLAADPFKAMAYTAYKGAKQAGEGLGGMIASAGGIDARTPNEKQLQAIQAAKAEVSKLNYDLTDPKQQDQFYKSVIQILQKQGLVAEAMMVAKEWHAETLGNKKLELGIAESQRKAAADIAKDQRAQERNAAIREAMGRKGEPVIQLLTELDRREQSGEPRDPLAEQELRARITKLTQDSGVILENLGGTMKVIKKGTGEEVRTDVVTEKPTAATSKRTDAQEKAKGIYDAAALQAQENYDAAVEALNHPGLDNAVGPVHGLALKSGDAGMVEAGILNVPGKLGGFTKAGVNFRAVYKRVLGGTFIAALKELKQASPTTGASGLGNLSNMEGDKIQSAKAALDPLQYPPQFRQELLGYINQLVKSWDVVTQAAARENIPPIPLRLKEISGQVQPGQTPVTPVTPKPAVPGAAASAAVAPTVPAAPAASLPQAPGWGVQWGTPVRKQ
jgi:hypothetical protein